MQRSMFFATVAFATDAATASDTPAITNADTVTREAAKQRQRKARTSAKPAVAKPPVAKAAKPAKPANKAEAAKREAARTANTDHHDKLRARAALFYSGPSNAAHKHKPAKLTDYISRVRTPVQAPAGGNASVRDESGLGLILSGADKGGRFDPCKLSIDLGVLSRLSALRFVSVGAGDSPAFTLTKAGIERARIVVKRAA